VSHATDFEVVWAAIKASSNIAGGLINETTHLYLVASIVCNPPTERTTVAELMNTSGDETDKMLAENTTATTPAVRTDAPLRYLTEKDREAGNDRTGERQVSAVDDTTLTDDSIVLK
jgi:hypothetical protein